MFDSREFVKALETPRFIDLDGKEHVGRLLSHAQMAVHYEALRGAFENIDKDPRGVIEVMVKACEQMFNAEAVEALKNLPGPAVEAAIVDFFVSHRQPPKAKSA